MLDNGHLPRRKSKETNRKTIKNSHSIFTKQLLFVIIYCFCMRIDNGSGTRKYILIIIQKVSLEKRLK